MEQPTMLGKYAVEGELGRGAMGIVYRGHDPDLDREVALKTFRKDTLDKSESAELLERFKREAKAGGRLQHPNIVSIYDYGEANDVAYIAMEIIQGQELKELFDQNQRFAPKDAVRLMGQLLDALEYAHRHGVVHRDIKPANLILMPDGTLKITDFGIARLESSTLTQAGTVLGTPTYMSPEQFMGQTVDGRSDLFSAGVILYQFLTGEKPFAGSSITTIMHKVLKEEPLKPSELNVQVPPAFDAVVKKALAKRPDDRFQSAAEFRAALMAAVETPAAAPEAETTAVNLAVPPVAAAAKQPAKLWLGLGLGGAALLAVFLLRPAAEPETPPAAAPGTAATPAPAATNAAAADEKKPPQTTPAKAHTPEKTAEKPKTAKTAQAAKSAASKKDKEKKNTSKKGVFGEDLKPSPWRKEGDLF